MYEAAIAGKLKAMYVIGEDMVQSDPNTYHVMKALKIFDLLIVQELFMTETCKLAHVVSQELLFGKRRNIYQWRTPHSKVQKVVEPIGEAGPMVRSSLIL